MSWLEQHIEEFVVPVIPDFDRTPVGEFHYFTQEELTVLKNAWRSIKRQAAGEPILLPGRDVFLFEVLARRENYPTYFVPECSRMTVRHLVDVIPKNCFLFDTGFAGSIPRNLGINRYSLLSHVDRSKATKQTFPRLSFSRSFALKIENTPKYWESGQIACGEVTQPLANPHQFESAARLTIEVYTNSSPKFINHHKPIALERRWM